LKNDFSASQLNQAAESAVVTLAISGNTQAFAEIVKRYQNRVRNFMRRLCNRSELADDLAQQAFLKTWKSIHQLKSPGAFYGWLKKIMISVWIEDVRRNKLEFVERDASDLPGAYRDTSGERLDLDAALARLSPAMRLCVVLAYNDGLSHKEIADITNTPIGTVKSNISRGAAQLRILLSDYHEGN
jgi:RNA polymerase sigma-70 factor (ECF subfamily)